MRTQIRSNQEVIDDALTFSEGKTFTNCGELEQAATSKYDVKIACLYLCQSISLLIDEKVPSYEIGYYGGYPPYELFELGHEISHIVLGHSHPNEMYDPKIGKTIIKEAKEREARLFARTILGWTERDEIRARRIAKLKVYSHSLICSIPIISIPAHNKILDGWKYLEENKFRGLLGWYIHHTQILL